MSRAFVKEPEGDQPDDALPDRPESPDPNYITPRGYLALQKRVAALITEQQALAPDGDALIVRQRLHRLDRDLRAARKRLERGDTALWDRPLGAIEIEVLSIRYPAA